MDQTLAMAVLSRPRYESLKSRLVDKFLLVFLVLSRSQATINRNMFHLLKQKKTLILKEIKTTKTLFLTAQRHLTQLVPSSKPPHPHRKV